MHTKKNVVIVTNDDNKEQFWDKRCICMKKRKLIAGRLLGTSNSEY